MRRIGEGEIDSREFPFFEKESTSRSWMNGYSFPFFLLSRISSIASPIVRESNFVDRVGDGQSSFSIARSKK